MVKEISEKDEKTKDKCKFKCNSYIIGTGIIVLLIIAFLLFGNVITGKASKTEVGEKTAEFLNNYFAQSGASGKVELKNVEEDSGLYKVNMIYNNEELSVYVTEDGKYIIPSQALSPLDTEIVTEQTQPTEIPKSDKPKVELFVFSYCPYGTQAEKGMIPVYDLLKDYADFEIVAIGAMHGEFEKTESLRQICIEKNYGKDVLFKYLKSFDENSKIGDCKGDEKCVNPLIESIYSSLSIDKNKIEACIEKDAEAIYNQQNEKAKSLGVTGSPTIVINGVEVPISGNSYSYNDQKIAFSRDANTYKKIVCSLFNTAPDACSEQLSSASPSAGFGSDEGSSSGSCG